MGIKSRRYNINNCIDILGREIKVGDVVASSSCDHGTTMRVISVDSWRLTLVRAYRGRKPVVLDGSGWRIVSR